MSYPIPRYMLMDRQEVGRGRQETDPRDTDPNLALGFFTCVCLLHLVRLCWFSVFQVTAINTRTKYTLLIFTAGPRHLTALFATKGKLKK